MGEAISSNYLETSGFSQNQEAAQPAVNKSPLCQTLTMVGKIEFEFHEKLPFSSELQV